RPQGKRKRTECAQRLCRAHGGNWQGDSGRRPIGIEQLAQAAFYESRSLRNRAEELKVWFAIGIIVVLLRVGVGSSIVARNPMVSKNEAVKAAWSQVDIAWQRRADLIPNLVETVKGYALQEQTVFGDIARARSQLLSAGTPTDKIAANQQLD